MKDVLEFGKRLLFSTVAALTILTIEFVILEWKNIVDPVFTCAICKESFWLVPKKVTILDHDMYICRACVRMVRELGQQIGSLFG